LQRDYEENVLEKRQIQNGGRDFNLLLVLFNLLAQVRSHCFSVKAIIAPLKKITEDCVTSDKFGKNIKVLFNNITGRSKIVSRGRKQTV
jgi:hypothetical protein